MIPIFIYVSICHMKRTTVFLPEALERELQLCARQEGRPTASLVREALAEYVPRHPPGADRPPAPRPGARAPRRVRRPPSAGGGPAGVRGGVRQRTNRHRRSSRGSGL